MQYYQSSIAKTDKLQEPSIQSISFGSVSNFFCVSTGSTQFSTKWSLYTRKKRNCYRITWTKMKYILSNYFLSLCEIKSLFSRVG